MRQRRDGIEFGPSRGSRFTTLFVITFILALVFLVRFLISSDLAPILFTPFIILLPWLFVLSTQAVQPSTVLTATELRFARLSWAIPVRRERIPWTAITHIDAIRSGPGHYPLIHLTDGTALKARYPMAKRNTAAFNQAIALIQQHHLEACQGVLPLPSAAPLPYNRVRVWVRVVSIALPLSLIPILGIGIAAVVNALHTSPDVKVCDYIPRDLAARFIPNGQIDDFGGGGAGCQWIAGTPEQSGTWLDVHIAKAGLHDPHDSFTITRQSQTRPVHRLKGDAYTMAWQDSWGYTSQGRARVDDYLVMVAIHTKRATSPSEAETQAAEILRAMTKKLAAQA
ncbi:hypothetical protein J4573_09215 [Actinomadura barringtoniae]|uniref:PH domain-containing protein n=1 Tax=Actinomadura barringtoniae TaxID=1427535 RepID=A0A939T5L9_9ACTN|nr:hypothetical protein [Actinomadura barringtoniae]MBO2447262.1 hypothetical protein [Actinomadura barringtoniae]